jgi:hypothetical protein
MQILVGAAESILLLNEQRVRESLKKKLSFSMRICGGRADDKIE